MGVANSILNGENVYVQLTGTERAQELVTCYATFTSSMQRNFGLGAALVFDPK